MIPLNMLKQTPIQIVQNAKEQDNINTLQGVHHILQFAIVVVSMIEDFGN